MLSMLCWLCESVQQIVGFFKSVKCANCVNVSLWCENIRDVILKKFKLTKKPNVFMSVNVGPWLKKNPNILTSIKNVSSFFCQLHIAINVSFDGATYLKCCMSSSVWPMVKPVEIKTSHNTKIRKLILLIRSMYSTN